MTPSDITAEIQKDIDRLTRELAKVDVEATRLQPKVYAAEDKAERTGKDADVTKATELAHTLRNLVARGTALSEKIQTLRRPAEQHVRERAAVQKEQASERLQELRDRSAGGASPEGVDAPPTDRPNSGRQTKGATVAAGTKTVSKVELARETAVKVITSATEPIPMAVIIDKVMKTPKVKDAGVSPKTVPTQVSREALSKDSRIVRVDRGLYAGKDLAATLKGRASKSGSKKSEATTA